MLDDDLAPLAPPGPPALRPVTDATPAPGLYGADLARLHHDHFGRVARGAAAELLRRLGAAGVTGLTGGAVVDLAAGSGILSRALGDAGYDVLGVDVSEDMLRIAREHAPAARFVRGSLWTAALPPCVGAAAVGEAFCYATSDDVPSLDGPAGLQARLRALAGALAPGGVLVFDVSCPGRSGPEGRRQLRWVHGSAELTLDEVEDPGACSLVRTIDTRVTTADGVRRVVERHTLRLYDPEEVAAALEGAGFEAERLGGYGDFTFLPGWVGFAATRR